MRRCLLVLTVTASCVVASAPAFAQSLPNLPGSGAIRRAIEDRVAATLPRTGTGALGGTGAGGLAGLLANAAANAPQPSAPPLADQSQDPQPAPARSRPARSSLPRTGAPALALALIGIALISAGRLLVELAPPQRA